MIFNVFFFVCRLQSARAESGKAVRLSQDVHRNSSQRITNTPPTPNRWSLVITFLSIFKMSFYQNYRVYYEKKNWPLNVVNNILEKITPLHYIHTVKSRRASENK